MKRGLLALNDELSLIVCESEEFDLITELGVASTEVFCAVTRSVVALVDVCNNLCFRGSAVGMIVETSIAVRFN